MPTAATHHAGGTPHCPRQGKRSCRVPQHIDFKLRWRRISTRQLTEALPKTRPVLVLHLAAHQLQRSAPVRCDATPLQLIMPAEQSTAQGKARQVLMLLPAAHQLQATLASNLHTPADRSTAQDKASARAAPRGTPTSRQSNRPVRCHRAAARHARGTKHCPRQGKCSCCVPQHTNFESHWRRISTRQLTRALPKVRPVLVLHLAAHQLQSRAPVQCDATALQLIMPAEQSIAQGKAGACAASRRTTTSSYAGGGSQPAS